MKKVFWYNVINCELPSPNFPRIHHVFQMSLSSSSDTMKGIDRKDEGFVYKLTINGHGYFKRKENIQVIKPGTLLFCRVNDPEIEYYPGNKIWEFIFVSISGKSFQNFGNEIINTYGSVYKELPYELIKEIFYSLKRENIPENKMTYRKNLQVLNQLLYFLIPSSPKTNLSLIEKAQQLISSSSLQVVNVSYLASQLNISREHLSREFKKVNNYTVNDAINQKKIELACLLLDTTSMKINEIAWECGIAKESFSKWFRDKLGCTPREYRKL